MLPKQSETSASSTHSAPRFPVTLIASRACWAERFGRKPKLTGRKSASKIGSSTIFAAAITTRSRTVGTVTSNCTSCSSDFDSDGDVDGVRDALAAGLLDLGREGDAEPVRRAAAGVELAVADPVVDDAD